MYSPLKNNIREHIQRIRIKPKNIIIYGKRYIKKN